MIQKYLSNIHNFYNNIDDYNPSRKITMLVVFDGMIADIISNKKFQAMVKELLIRWRKLNISLVFIIQPFLLFEKKSD